VEDINKEKTCTKEGRELGGMHATGGDSEGPGFYKGMDAGIIFCK
jgi:hypothetical protein